MFPSQLDDIYLVSCCTSHLRLVMGVARSIVGVALA